MRASLIHHGEKHVFEACCAAPGERAQLEVLVREAVETLVYGD